MSIALTVLFCIISAYVTYINMSKDKQKFHLNIKEVDIPDTVLISSNEERVESFRKELLFFCEDIEDTLDMYSHDAINQESISKILSQLRKESEKFKKSYCEAFGHYHVKDVCGLPQHDFCTLCFDSLPYQANKVKISI